MFAEYVLRGVKAGLVAGLVFGLFVAVVANPLVAFADELGHGEAAIEADGDPGAAGADHDHDGSSHDATDHGVVGETGHDHGVVSATTTSVVSIASSVLWGVLLGAVVFGGGFYLLEPVLPGDSGSATPDVAAGSAGFLSASVAPWLVLPPQPPGARQFLAVSTRVRLYAGMVALGVVCCLLALYTFDRLSRRDRRSTTVAAAAALVPFGLLAVPVVLAPANPVENPLPAELSAGLVGLTVFGQALLWAVLAGAHAWLRRESSSPPADDRRAAGSTNGDRVPSAD
ncbi:CbtA family protein [Halopenitus salinus]|uniref:CbtA family protein n=1 Tax=Halopenitus salinus TaxID=1198295 RepID=A0ABD5V0X2_9EURY